jgi:hypothetical protein
MTVIINGTDNAVGNPAIQGGTGGTTAGLYYPAANTVAITTSGVNALTISSTQAATFAGTLTTASQGIAFAALPTGSVLQVVSQTYADTTSITSSSYTDTGITVTITPKFSTSKILIIVSVQCSAAANQFFPLSLVRNSTLIAQPNSGGSQPSTMNGYVGDLNIATEVFNVGMNYLDSPATTSATVYKIQGKTSGGTAAINTRPDGVGKQVSSITVMEIAA